MSFYACKCYFKKVDSRSFETKRAPKRSQVVPEPSTNPHLRWRSAVVGTCPKTGSEVKEIAQRTRLFLTEEEAREVVMSAQHGQLDGKDCPAVLHVVLGVQDAPLLSGALKQTADEVTAYLDAMGAERTLLGMLLFGWAQRLYGLAALARVQDEMGVDGLAVDPGPR